MHRSDLAVGTPVGVVTISDTRTREDDGSGDAIAGYLTRGGCVVMGKVIVPDEPDDIRAAVTSFISGGARAVVLTGGTGVSSRDITIEALKFDRELPGFGELFRYLSYMEIGPRSMASRATLGLMGTVPVFCLPGSVNAVTLAMEKIIMPELGHLLHEVKR